MNSNELRSLREDQIDLFEKIARDNFAARVTAALKELEGTKCEADRRRATLATRGDRVVWVRTAQGGSDRYHSSRYCGCLTRRDSLNEFKSLFEEEAIEAGWTACQRCGLAPLTEPA